MKRFIVIILIVLFALSSTGCSRTKQEINNISVVLAVGFDLTPENKYIFEAQILNTQSSKKSPSNVVVFTSTGDTPYDAINRMSTSLGKNLFFGHSAYIIVGDRLSQNGVSLIIDALLRNPDTRPDRPFLATKGNALDIIKAITIDEKVPASSIDNILKFQVGKGFVPLTTRLDFANALGSKTAAPIAGMINLEKNIKADNTFSVAGTAVFKKDKLAGYLDKKETRGMQWVNGKIKTGNLVVETKNMGIITFDVLNTNSKIKPIINNDSITMQINIKVKSNIIEMTENLDLMKNPDEIQYLNKLQNKAIESEVKLTLQKAQKIFKADIFDFGSIIHRSNPKLWNTIKNDWQDIYPNIKVEVTVDSSIKRPGSISKPIKQ